MRDTRIVRAGDQVWIAEIDMEPRFSDSSSDTSDVPMQSRIIFFRTGDIAIARTAPDQRELHEFSDEELLHLLHGEGPAT